MQGFRFDLEIVYQDSGSLSRFAFDEGVDVLDAFCSELLDEVIEVVLEIEQLLQVIAQLVVRLRLVLRLVLINFSGHLLNTRYKLSVHS